VEVTRGFATIISRWRDLGLAELLQPRSLSLSFRSTLHTTRGWTQLVATRNHVSLLAGALARINVVAPMLGSVRPINPSDTRRYRSCSVRPGHSLTTVVLVLQVHRSRTTPSAYAY